jgi:uncharacterized protein (DUF1697 family)
MTDRDASDDTTSDPTWVVLLRGINVGPSARVSMGELRDLVIGLGFQDVKTLLQSGNVVLRSKQKPDVDQLEGAIASGTGVKSRVVVLGAESFRTIVQSNPLLPSPRQDGGDDPSKLVITFLQGDIVPTEIDRPSDLELEPERLVITSRAVYQWCPDGILKSRLKPQWWKQFGPTATARNVRTANRILDLLPPE